MTQKKMRVEGDEGGGGGGGGGWGGGGGGGGGGVSQLKAPTQLYGGARYAQSYNNYK